MATPHARDSVLVVGASGRTGLCLIRYLCSTSVPVVACVRRADRLPAEPRLAAAEVAVVNLEQPAAMAPLIDRVAHVVYVAGSARKSLSPGAWQIEVDGLATCVEFAQRSGFPGRWIYVGMVDDGRTAEVTWAESRWREMKREAVQVITASSLNYFILHTGRVTEAVDVEPRVRVSQSPTAPRDAELPCNVLAFLLCGAVMVGASHRSQATVRVDPSGMKLQEAARAFSRLKSDPAPQAADSLGPMRVMPQRR
jgi:hypothetical protein